MVISGRITDSLGNPVVDAEVTTSSANFESPSGTGRTDADGRYTVNSTRPHFASVYIAALKPGFVPYAGATGTVLRDGTADQAGAHRQHHADRADVGLRVGELVEMPASKVVFDSGETRNIFVLPTSSPTSVVLSKAQHQLVRDAGPQCRRRDADV